MRPNPSELDDRSLRSEGGSTSLLLISEGAKKAVYQQQSRSQFSSRSWHVLRLFARGKGRLTSNQKNTIKPTEKNYGQFPPLFPSFLFPFLVVDILSCFYSSWKKKKEVILARICPCFYLV
jgi:hypothetical protein